MLSTLTVSKLGLTTATLTVVYSYMMMSLLVDQFGWLAVPTHPVNFSRVFAIALLIVSITLPQNRSTTLELELAWIEQAADKMPTLF